MNYGRQVLLNPSTQYTGGLVQAAANPEGGIFGAQGYGGGIFDGSSPISGLGQAPMAPGGSAPASPPTGSYPWGEYSDGTLSIQHSVNYELGLRDLPLIGEDGKLGPETCGATQWIADNLGMPEHQAPSTCQSFAPYPPTATAPPGPGAQAPAPAPTTPTPRYRKAGMSTGGMLLIGAAVAGLGIYAWTRTK